MIGPALQAGVLSRGIHCPDLADRLRAAAVLAVLFAAPAWSQTGAQAQGSEQASPIEWSFNLALAGYLVPNDVWYASPTFMADRNRLHLEARYNYEDQQTGSAWLGYNFSAGDKLEFAVTPILGAVFGNTTGIAPGYEFSLTYKKLELSSDGEYVCDTRNSSESFFYSWNEFVYSPADWFHAGLVTQRTRAYHTALNVQRGFSVGVAHKNTDFTVYTFNAGWTDPTVVLILSWKF
jgi:hypothetical protein